MKNLLYSLLGLSFLISGIAKAADINGFADTLLAYGTPKLYYVAPFIAAIEIAFAFAFLFQFRLKRVALLSIYFISVLTVILLYGFFVKGIDDCGCFGSFLSIPIWLSLLRNLFMIGASFWLYRNAKEQSKKFRLLKVTLITVLTLATFGASAYEMVSTYRLPKYTVGTEIKNTFLNKFQSEAGKTLVFDFSPLCTHCAEEVPKINKLKKQDSYINVVGLNSSIEDSNAILSFKGKTNPNFETIEVPMDSILKITRRYPYFLILEKGQITKVFSTL